MYGIEGDDKYIMRIMSYPETALLPSSGPNLSIIYLWLVELNTQLVSLLAIKKLVLSTDMRQGFTKGSFSTLSYLFE